MRMLAVLMLLFGLLAPSTTAGWFDRATDQGHVEPGAWRNAGHDLTGHKREQHNRRESREKDRDWYASKASEGLDYAASATKDSRVGSLASAAKAYSYYRESRQEPAFDAADRNPSSSRESSSRKSSRGWW